MSEKKEREKKDAARRVQIGVDFLYNPETQAFVDKIRTKHSVKLPFTYDYSEQAQEEAPKELVEDVGKFVDESWEPVDEAERLLLDKNDPLGTAKSFKKAMRAIGLPALIFGIFMPKKLIKRLTKDMKDPIQEMDDYRESSLVDYVMTGEVESFSPDIFESLLRVNLKGEPFVVMIASELASPDIAAAKFQKFFLEEFDKKKRPTDDPVRDSRWYEMKKAGVAIRDIADQWIEEHEEEFPEIGTNEYLDKKRELDEYVKSRIKQFSKRIE